MAIGQDLLAVPFDKMLLGIARAIIEAQRGLDENAASTLVAVLKALKSEGVPPPDYDKWLEELQTLVSKRLLPTFYQFADTEIEVKMAISSTRSSDFSVSGKVNLSCVGIDATYSQKYSYSAEGASLIRTRLVPVMPPEQLKALMEALDTHAALPAPPQPTPAPGG